jgi:(heptosyl)LPS beta-1,4-glucosyltransferase
LAAINLSVCVISKNEASDLSGFLENVLHIANEVVIVDDNSTDETKDIALSYGNSVKFISHPMEGQKHFANQRNICIENATGTWLLHMDVDERLTPELARSVLLSIENTTNNAFRYRRLNYFINYPMKGGGWQYWNNPQLARRGHHKFVNHIHEECKIDGGDSKTGQLEGFMWHLVDASYRGRLEKNILYSELMSEKILQQNISVKWFHILFKPLFRSLKSFLYYKGFRHGTRGLIFALYTFTGTFNWYAFAWFRQNQIERKEIERKLKVQWNSENSDKQK